MREKATLGLLRCLGSIIRNGSGDIFVAFSTANKISTDGEVEKTLAMVKNDYINPIFKATVEATEESIVNALIAGEDMVGQYQYEELMRSDESILINILKDLIDSMKVILTLKDQYLFLFCSSVFRSHCLPYSTQANLVHEYVYGRF